MSASFDATEELTATASAISNADFLAALVYVKLPDPFSGFGGLNNILNVSGSNHNLQVFLNADPDARVLRDYGTSGNTGTALASLDTWMGIAVTSEPNDGSGQNMRVYDTVNSTDSSDYNNQLSRSTDGLTENMNSISIGSTGSGDDIPGIKVAEAAIYSASDQSTLDAVIDAFLGGTRPGSIGSGTLRWYRDMESNGTSGSGTGDLSGTGVTYDSGDHPSFAAASSFRARIISLY